MSTLSDILQAGASKVAGMISPGTANAGPATDRKQFIDYTTDCSELGVKPLAYADWVAAGRPSGATSTPPTNDKP